MISPCPRVNNAASPSEGKVYADCVTHAKNWKQALVPGSKTTSSHELTHFINAENRNARGVRYRTTFVRNYCAASEDAVGSYSYDYFLIKKEEPVGVQAKTASAKINCFYLLNDRVLIASEPRIRKSTIIPYVPKPLRWYRFDTYISGQREWDDTPLYVWDEWIAYINGATCAVDLLDNGKYNEQGRDILVGVLEFMLYGAAVMLATKEKDPDSHEKLVFPFQKLWSLSRDLWFSNRNRFPFSSQEQYFESMRVNELGSRLRSYCATIGVDLKDPPKDSSSIRV